MADNKTITDGIAGTIPIATDEIAGVNYQRVKISVGADGVAADATSANPVPVDDDATQTLLAALIALLPAALAANGGLKIEGVASGTAVPVSGSIGVSGTMVVDSSHAEDAAHASGDAGAFVLGVRKDTATQLAGTDGDYSPLITDANGRLHVVTVPGHASTATLSNVAASASSVTVLALNTSRKGCVVVNDSTVGVYLKFGSAASATSYSYRLEAKQTLELPNGNVLYDGIITGIWDSATGNARVTELT